MWDLLEVIKRVVIVNFAAVLDCTNTWLCFEFWRAELDWKEILRPAIPVHQPDGVRLTETDAQTDYGCSQIWYKSAQQSCWVPAVLEHFIWGQCHQHK